MNAFLDHPENFYWGRIFLAIVFFLAFFTPFAIAYLEERQMKRYQKRRELEYLKECEGLGKKPIKMVTIRK